MSDDGDHLLVAGRDEEAGAPAPASRRSLRRQEDEHAYGPGVEPPDTRLKRQKAPKTMYDRWRAIMEPVTDLSMDTNVTSRVTVSIFNRHINEMESKGYSRAEIERAFQAFAAAVEMGVVTFRRPQAWFTFYGSRERYLTYDTADIPKRERFGEGRKKRNDFED